MRASPERAESGVWIRPVRTLFFVEHFWPYIGGVETVTAQLVPLLAERGHELVIVTDQEDASLAKYELLGQVPVRRLPFTRALRERDLELLVNVRAAVSELVRQHRPELIHAHVTGPGAWLLPGPEVAPMIVSLHNVWPTIERGSSGAFFARVIGRAAWVTACSEHTLASFLSAAPELAGRSSVIHNGLDAAFDGEPPDPPAGPPALLCAGRIDENKGMDVAIDAFAAVVRDHPDARLLIAGDGAEFAALVARAESLSVGERVDFLGWVAPGRVHELVARASIVLIPSRRESFGLVALEAGLMARPVIATNLGGLPEVVEDGVTGVLVEPDDAPATAHAISRLLADPLRARAMGWAGRARMLEHFSAGRHAEEWDALYQRIGARNRPWGT